MIRAVRRQRPELWARWAASGDAALLPVAAPLTRGGVPAARPRHAGAARAARRAALPTGQSVALAIRPTNIRGLRCWWLCPVTGGTCAALFLPDGADAHSVMRLVQHVCRCLTHGRVKNRKR
jgi:hypothetical protein